MLIFSTLIKKVTFQDLTPNGDPELDGPEPAINRQGFGHIAFHVDAVEETAQKLVAQGGKILGEIIHQDYGDPGFLTALYAQDPEGNFIETQNWGGQVL